MLHLRDTLIPRYAELVYNGFWFAPEREALQALIDEAQSDVTGTVRLKLYKGNVHRRRPQVAALALPAPTSPRSRRTRSTTSATPRGFIHLNALRLKIRALRDRAR